MNLELDPGWQQAGSPSIQEQKEPSPAAPEEALDDGELQGPTQEEWQQVGGGQVAAWNQVSCVGEGSGWQATDIASPSTCIPGTRSEVRTPK